VPAVKELHEEYTEKLKELRDLAAKAETEERDFTAEEREEVVRRTDELKGLKAKIKEEQGDDELRKAIDQLGDDLGINDEPGKGKNLPAGTPGKKGSIGQRFVESEEFKSFLGQFPNGRIPDSAKGLISPPVQFKDVLTGAGADSAGAFIDPDRTGIYEPLGRRPLTVRDLISTRTTGSDQVEFVRQLTRLDAAAAVPEATTSEPIGSGEPAVTDAQGGLKPKGTFTFQKVTRPVSTLAVWVPATKRALSDAAQLRGLIDDELRADLEEELEDQIVTGDGDDENFEGLLETSGVQTQAFDTDEFVTTRKARTKVRVTGRAQATGYLIHPNDWERIDLKRDGQERFHGAGPFAMTTPTLWGLPVVESEAVTEGTALCGDFRKAVLWDREQTSIQVSDSHADFFVRNLVAVLAEMRAAFGVIRPAAFVKITIAGGGS
jgi:HK97 family phage major capsid protein